MKDMVEFTFDTSRPLIKTFFEGITAGQWYSLTASYPDNGIKILLVQLLLDIIKAATNSLLVAHKNASLVISEEQVQVKLSKALTQSFAEILDAENLAECQL